VNLGRKKMERFQPGTLGHSICVVCVVAILLVSWRSSCSGQQLTSRMENQDVIDMVSLGLSDAVIIDKIHTTQVTDFDTSVAALRVLKAGKVSDAVIRAMINAHSSGVVSSVPVAPVAATLPEEVGVYVVLHGKLTEIEPEIVNWQTGGWVKSHASLGIVKGDVNGKVMGSKSPLQVSDEPVDFLIRTLEGTSVTEYQLLRLHEKSDRREFRAATGGVIHQSGGAEPNSISFAPEKVGSRTWKIELHDLQKGEYGFLPPGLFSKSISSSGKIYTFCIVEGGNARLWNVAGEKNTDHVTIEPDLDSSGPHVFKEATIGAFSNLNPNVQRDGVTLTAVTAGGPADQVGIKIGDVILSINDHYLFTVRELNEEISHHQPGTKIAVRYRRYSTIYDISVVVGAK